MSSASFQRCGKKTGSFCWGKLNRNITSFVESDRIWKLKISQNHSQVKSENKKKTHQTKKTLTLEMWHLIRTHKKPLRLKCDSLHHFPPAPTPGRVGNQRTAHPNEGGGNGNGACLLDEGFTQLLLQLRTLGLRFLSSPTLCRCFGWWFLLAVF